MREGTGMWKPCLPGQLQLSVAYSDTEVLVQGTSEMKVLMFVSTAEQSLGGFVEALGDMVQHGWGAVL